ncbi:MAG TPA: PASTA domain-containing protein [Streptosporangiaceae bacterium]|jgi:hypothetical protein|nr:PASTA domain-containing protein [Streptosporangiaceae bacterium]
MRYLQFPDRDVSFAQLRERGGVIRYPVDQDRACTPQVTGQQDGWSGFAQTQTCHGGSHAADLPDQLRTSLPVPTPVTTVPGVTRIALSIYTVLVLAPAVTMPDVVGELRASALGHLHALGLSVQELSVADNRYCDNVGYVESQNPPPGTVVGPGTHVTIRVYVRPQAGCF